MPTSCCSRRTRIVRARRSPGTSSMCCGRRCRCGGWSSTRSPGMRSSVRSATRGRSTSGSSTHRRRVGSSTGSTATRCRPCSGRRSCRGLSAGRVQSVATRLVVEREQERMRFRPRRVLGSRSDVRPGVVPAQARPARREARRAGSGLRRGRRAQGRPGEARRVAGARPRRRLEGAEFAVRSVEEKPYSRRPSPPFMTSTLQQEASRKLRFTAQTTMRVAQRLYERGYITYMRTDSTTLSESALAARARRRRELFGAESVPATPRQYDRRSRTPRRRTRRSGRPVTASALRGAGEGTRPGRARALRARLAADDRVTDGRREGEDGVDPSRCRVVGGPGCGVRRLRHGDHGARVPRRLRGGPRRRG